MVQTNMRMKGCPRCSGDQYWDQDEGAWTCMQAGHRQYPAPLSQEQSPILDPTLMGRAPGPQEILAAAQYDSIGSLYFEQGIAVNSITTLLNISLRTLWRGVEQQRQVRPRGEERERGRGRSRAATGITMNSAMPA